jgi:hypothetical protein
MGFYQTEVGASLQVSLQVQMYTGMTLCHSMSIFGHSLSLYHYYYCTLPFQQ